MQMERNVNERIFVRMAFPLRFFVRRLFGSRFL
jgi:hypothetical protein